MFAGPQVTYKLKQKKKKAMRNEMKFGVNVAAPFVGMKRDQRHMESEYPFAKQVRHAILSVTDLELAASMPSELQYRGGSNLPSKMYY